MSTAYAVIYRPLQDGSWAAHLADWPDVQVTGEDIGVVKSRIRQAGRQRLKAGEKEPALKITVGYVYLDERPDDPA